MHAPQFFEADLHTDRLSANRQREVAWDYRNLELCPMELLPGFAFHQTTRAPLPGQPGGDFDLNDTRTRDFDLLGYRYSLLSSIGTAGLNNVVCLIPARNVSENEHFPPEDTAFIRGWLAWTDANKALLATMAPISAWGRPGVGKADGNLAVLGGVHGVTFMFNPTARPITKAVTMDATWRIVCDAATGLPAFDITELHPTRRLARAAVPCGSFSVTIPATSALVLEMAPAPPAPRALRAEPRLVGAPGRVRLEAGARVLHLSGVEGDAGAAAPLEVRWTTAVSVGGGGGGGEQQERSVVERVTVNGEPVPAHAFAVTSRPVALAAGAGAGSAAAVAGGGGGGGGDFGSAVEHTVRLDGRFGGAPFAHMQEIGATPRNFSGGAWSGGFSVPAAVMAQLSARNASYPIAWGPEESIVPWLVPGRLLGFVKYAPLVDDKLNVTGFVDDASHPVHVVKAWNTITESAGRFIGWFFDLTALVKPGTAQTLHLQLPELSTDYRFAQGFLNAGSDLESGNFTLAGAKAHCNALDGCVGFTFENAQCGGACPVAADPAVLHKVLFKASAAGSGSPTWCAYTKPPQIDGVFFENVETLTSSQWLPSAGDRGDPQTLS